MKSRIYITEIDEMTHDELATRAARMAEANDDGMLAGLAADLREEVNFERDSMSVVESIKKHIEGLP